jgi:hypothetical protein
MNSRGLKDGRGCRIGVTTGLENVGPVLSDMIGKVHRTLNFNDTTMNNYVLTTDLYIQITNETNKQGLLFTL